MTEDDAKTWIIERFGDETAAVLAAFIAMVQEESEAQNLVSRASLETIWARHIVDSAQLVDLAQTDGTWIDVGTGAGFPGMVTAIVSRRPTVLVEPRRRRAEFLQRVIDTLELGQCVTVQQRRIETVQDVAGVISARAVSTIDGLLKSCSRCMDRRTLFLLPKGLRSREEVAQAQKSWHGTFHVEHSVTDPESMIVVASGVSRR